MSVYDKLAKIQAQLFVPKGQKNNFGNYSYRSCEDILKSVKPICDAEKCVLFLTNSIVNVGDRIYIEARAVLHDLESGEEITSIAQAREEEIKKGMDASQVSGSCSSYARKYCLAGLFCIDNEKDSDATNTHGKSEEEVKAIAKDNKKTAEIEAMKIAPVKVTALQVKCQNDGVSEEKLCAAYRIKSFADLTEKQYMEINANWERAKKSCGV